MDTVFCTGKEIRELKRRQADCWILYIANGEADLIAGDHFCHASTGFVVIAGLTQADVRIHASEDCESYILQVNDPESYELVRNHLHLMNISEESISVIPAGRQQSNILTVFKKLMAQKGNTLALRELLLELMVRLHRASLKIASGIHNNRMDLVSDLQKYLKNEYSQDITLEKLAEKYRISISYLSHVFKNTTGISIMRYLIRCRVAAAKEQLTESDLSINDIAKQCGFHDISNFGRAFKRELGISPREYRKQYGTTISDG